MASTITNGPAKEANQGCDRTGGALQPLADLHRELDPVGAGDGLSQREIRQEGRLIEPAALQHHVAIEPPGRAAAKAGAPQPQKRAEDPREADGRQRYGRGASFETAPLRAAPQDEEHLILASKT